MDTLKSMQDNLCVWLSSNPDYIIEQCGDILSRNQFRDVEKQSAAVEKMRVLLKIIIQKGEDTCQCFYEILKQHQAHYQQLQQFFTRNTQGSCRPKVFADSNSVVTNREITNFKAKSLTQKIHTVTTSTGSSQSGIAVGQAPQADYTALNGGVICADKISGLTIDGDVDFSVHTSHVSAAKPTTVQSVDSSQGPSVKMITEHKVKLTDWLRADPSFIVQHVHAKSIVTDRQYQQLRNTLQPEDTVIDLIDQLTLNGEEACSRFLEVLKDTEILGTYPQLKGWIGTVVSSGRE